MKMLSSLQPLALLLLRAALGLIFITHGYPKLVHGAGMQSFFIEHGLPGYFLYVAGVMEFFGGGLLLLGLFTRGAALLLAFEMFVAIWKVHSSRGILAVHEYEFPLALAMACLALATVGAGLISIDHPLFGNGTGKSRGPRNPKN
ncbi:MAG TPA: DoxX family protein [Candidatus Acidoferrum sp.]|nr:DoxX family protein [Candidatus Acidoferrum sp.]